MGLSNFGKTMNSVTSIAQNVRSSLNKFKGIVSSDTTNSSIRDRYTNGFYGDTTQFVPSVFSRLFDEPTYLTFRIEFDFSPNKIENSNDIESGNKWMSLDYMPEPLLSLASDEKTSNLELLVKVDDDDYDPLDSNIRIPNINTSFFKTNHYKNSFYSTYRYLKDALGETQRAEMLKKFILALKDIQDNYPYYFTGIEGLNSLSMVRPDKGIRLDDDNNTITINCVEGLDLKITQLMQLYRKIAWDDVYQRWILPDMMRFFNLKIYVSEIRLFHTMSRNSSAKSVGRVYDLNSNNLNATSYDKLTYGTGLLGVANSVVNTALGMSDSIFGPGSGVSKVLSDINMGIDSVSSLLGSIKGNMKLCDNAINDVMPTIVYDCKMCEFDIENTLEHINSLTSSKEGLQSPTPNIKIKVGKVYEKMYFPLSSGLINDGKTYDLSKRKDILQFVFEDEILKDSTTKYDDTNLYKNRLENNSYTRKEHRINKKFGNIDKDAEAYDPFTADKKTSLIALTGGVVGFFGTSHDSEAIEGDHTQEVRNLYATSEPIQPSEAASKNYSHLKTAKTSIHESEANNVEKSKLVVDPNKAYNPSINESSNGIIDEKVGMYNSSAVVLGENKQKTNAVEIQQSTATNNNPNQTETHPLHQSTATNINDKQKESNPLHQSTATSQEREIQQIINEEGAENVISAATSIKKLIKYIEDNDIIKSVATDEESNKEILKSIVFENTIETLSTATDENASAVKKLASMIKKEYLHKSIATDMSSEKRQNIIQTFNFLNSNYGS